MFEEQLPLFNPKNVPLINSSGYNTNSHQEIEGIRARLDEISVSSPFEDPKSVLSPNGTNLPITHLNDPIDY